MHTMLVKHDCKHYEESYCRFWRCPSCNPTHAHTLIDMVSNNSNNYSYITMNTFAREKISGFY